MKKILFILFLLPLFCISQNTWFNMYPRGDVQVAPTITITSATASYTSIHIGYSTTLGTPTATEAGFCWNTIGNPTTYDNTKSENINSGADDIIGLTHNTTYYVRAYIISTMGTYYSNPITRTTLNGLPVVVTAQTPSSIGSTTAECGGQISSSGGASVSDMGICWSSSNGNPSLSDSHASKYVGDETGFVAALSGLSQNTLYYFRAYAINSFGNGYGSVYNFTTTSGAVIPTVSTTSITNITSSTASSGGNITSDGGSTVTSRGVCWSIFQNPTISDSHTTDGTGTGSFISSLTGLTYATTYYVRAYATNSAGTAYGSQVSFTTSCILPIITTQTISSITQNSASGGGNVTANGGCSITARGVCYATTQNPTLSNFYTTDGTGTGSFTSSLIGLSNNTTYYVRAYATSSSGTSYGSQTSFTTLCDLPYVVGVSIDILSTSATITSTAQTDGGCSITARGVCYATTQYPTLSNSHTADGTGTGTFVSVLTGLTPNTTYYERPYAINSTGTYYGSQLAFLTNPDSGLPVVSTDTPYSFYSVMGDVYYYAIMYGGNASSDGGNAITDRGVLLSVTNSVPTVGGAGVTKSQVGSGTGTYQSSNYTYDYDGDPALYTPGQTLYIRSYATNSNGTSYGTVQTFTTCARPTSGLTQQFITDCIRIDAGSIVCFYNSQSGAESACFDIRNPGGRTITQGGITCYATSLSVGGTVYAYGSTTSCNKFNGYGYYYDTTEGEGKIIYVSGGTIQSKVSCNSCPSVGSSFRGGIVTHIFQSGENGYYAGECHGIISADSDISTGIQWYNGTYTSIGTTQYGVGYGKANTEAIVSSQGSGSYAAKLCYDLTLNGYSDWWLPSSVELVYYTYGRGTDNYYWSSTEYNQNQAIANLAPYAGIVYTDKATFLKVKPIRYF